MEAFHYWFLILNGFFIEVGKVLTTSSGDGRVIWAKFKSFLGMLLISIWIWKILFSTSVPMMLKSNIENGWMRVSDHENFRSMGRFTGGGGGGLNPTH